MRSSTSSTKSTTRTKARTMTPTPTVMWTMMVIAPMTAVQVPTRSVTTIHIRTKKVKNNKLKCELGKANHFFVSDSDKCVANALICEVIWPEA
ncbi:hypothetical protein PHMEG_00025785 [Phytophthora megakarya]|uniref:Uncharacterized protein n=1 Tax=Phytophthora megakarya TaxID=4795 RepID=A0A225VBB3_9STRA|nr:hypothetical protein PHMEG_00025785 [Phytophthora megakarya]